MTEKNWRTRPEQIAPKMADEEWRPVLGHDGYFVSSMGRVCSVDRTITRSTGSDQFCRGRLLRPRPQSKEHLSVTLSCKKTAQVHSLVLEAFVGPRPYGLECLHHDDDPTNNRLSNLRWGTRSDNIRDGIRNGKYHVGERVYNARLTDEAVRFIRANPHLPSAYLGNRFGVHETAVRFARSGKTWKHVK